MAYQMDKYMNNITDPNNKTIKDLASFKFNTFPDWISSSLAEEFLITSNTANTPDLISFAKYGTSELYWVICLANRIEDPFKQLPVGKVIKLPDMSKIIEFINSVDDLYNSSSSTIQMIELN